MIKTERFDRIATGIISGFLFPVLIGLLIYLFTAGGRSIPEYLKIIGSARIITHAITLCVFPNILVFFLFNRLDMLRASRGVLTITIIWAITVFIVKFI